MSEKTRKEELAAIKAAGKAHGKLNAMAELIQNPAIPEKKQETLTDLMLGLTLAKLDDWVKVSLVALIIYAIVITNLWIISLLT